jgi:hypothetical protein
LGAGDEVAMDRTGSASSFDVAVRLGSLLHAAAAWVNRHVAERAADPLLVGELEASRVPTRQRLLDRATGRRTALKVHDPASLRAGHLCLKTK